MKQTIIFLLFSNLILAQSLKTPFEKGNGNQTPTYEEMMKFYAELDAKHKTISTKNYGLTDSGEPVKVVFFNSEARNQ